MFIFVLASVLMSSVSLIALTVHLTAEAVDGSWSDWASWEACSTTCGVGLQTRHRNCSSPAPLGDGRQCLGEVNEHRLCMPGPCSNGGWSAWGRWGSCSASCDVGLKSRLRTCTRPRPSPFGSFCEGDNMQTEICGGEPCSDGGWSAWGSWGSCSASCDVGLKSRLRTCTRPRPSPFGSFCEGDNTQAEICGREPCSDGGWSAWGSWGSCSASCDVGLKSRLRTCTHPRPSPFGSFCEGDNTQAEICGREPCNETRVAFNVYESSLTGYNESHTVIFTGILLNEGKAYNRRNGIFTAPFNGLYQFNGQVCTAVGKDVDYAIKIEGESIAGGEYRTPSDATDEKCTSFSTVASVQEGEKVWIESSYLFQNDNDWNSFSGILIHKT